MKTLTTLVFASLCSALLLTGCLTASRKAISLHVNGDGSGTGSIIFYGISSMQEEDADNSLTDYSRLVDQWINGDEFENANPALEKVTKRLFTERDSLNGEITFSFSHYSDIGLFRYKNAGPWMYYAQLNLSEVEQFDSSTGDYGGEMMPVIFWPEKTSDFKIFNTFSAGERPVTSLLPLYNRIGVKKKGKG